MNSKSIAPVLLSLTFLATSLAYGNDLSPNGPKSPDRSRMQVLTPATMPSVPGPVENFTGSVMVTMLVQGERPSNLGSASVSFQPAARSAWHSHPKGQLLVVTNGSGLAQEWGQPALRIQRGDVVWTPPGVKHWHGAAPTVAMTHIATQESLNGTPVEWKEKVTDEQYSEATGEGNKAKRIEVCDENFNDHADAARMR